METIDQDDDGHERAFVSAKAGFELFGESLRKYSPSRKVAAQSMGLIYPYIGDDAAAQMEATGIYPGALKDTIICLWLCTLQDASDQDKAEIRAGAWNPSRVLHKPREALDAAMQWAADLEICDAGSERFGEAFKTFISIATAVEASKFQIVVEGVSHHGGDDGPNV